MSNRLAVVVAASLLFGSACTPSRAAIMAGAGTMLLGGITFAAGAPNSNCTYSGQCGGVDSFVDGVGDDINEGVRTLGAGMFITGALLLVVGLATNNDDGSHDEGKPVRITNLHAPAVDVVFEQPDPTLSAPGMVDRLATPAEMAVRSRIENRLWIQARVAASRGDCVAAGVTSKQLAQVDPALHAELMRTDVDVAICVELMAKRAN